MSPTPPKMQHISAPLLSTSLPSRITYLTSFLELTPSDGEALLAAKPLIAPLIPTVLDMVYTKLLSFDITAKTFVPRNTGYEGEVVKDVQELTLEHPQIAMRKDFLKNYLVRLVSTPDLTPTSSFWTYLNNVGIMHTGLPGFKHRVNKPELRVEYIHMSALLGYVVDIFIGAVMGIGDDVLDGEGKGRVIRALNKVVWIQNDLFARHYMSGDGVGVVDGVEKLVVDGEEGKEKGEGKGEKRSGGCPFSG